MIGFPFLIIIVAIFVILFLVIFFSFVPIPLWFSAVASGVRVSLIQLFLMRFRRVPPKLIVEALISAQKAGIDITTNMLETHYLAGGQIIKVVQSLIAANKAKINLDFSMAAAIDLAGRDVLEAVQTSVNPKVIDCPKAGMISAVAKDGIQLKGKARVTVRTNIANLVGGATEDTIIARVGEGVVSAIGSSENYKIVLENPDLISKVVLERGLDSGTAFEILSIDIADIDVGDNVGAALQTDQAEADLKIAQARAETRRAMAIAQEQEMKAKAQEMQAKVIDAQAQVPLAMAEALKSGKLGVMDYYRLKNIESDTGMRDAISRAGDEKPEGNNGE